MFSSLIGKNQNIQTDITYYDVTAAKPEFRIPKLVRPKCVKISVVKFLNF